MCSEEAPPILCFVMSSIKFGTVFYITRVSPCFIFSSGPFRVRGLPSYSVLTQNSNDGAKISCRNFRLVPACCMAA